MHTHYSRKFPAKVFFVLKRASLKRKGSVLQSQTHKCSSHENQSSSSSMWELIMSVCFTTLKHLERTHSHVNCQLQSHLPITQTSKTQKEWTQKKETVANLALLSRRTEGSRMKKLKYTCTKIYSYYDAIHLLDNQ